MTSTLSSEVYALLGLKDGDFENAVRLLQAWDYTSSGHAKKAYESPSIERLQLIRQIDFLLEDGMGFSTLFNRLEETRGKMFHSRPQVGGFVIQPWWGLGSSVKLRDFVDEHSPYLHGKIINKKWSYFKGAGVRTKLEINEKSITQQTLKPETSVVSKQQPSVHNIQLLGGNMKIIRPAARVIQGQLKIYTTSLRVRDFMEEGFFSIERLDPTSSSSGYQRVLNEARANKLAKYILDSQDAQDGFLPTSVFLATDKAVVYNEENNTIEIDIASVCPFSVVDGQHRIAGLLMAAEKDERVQDFEIPVNIAAELPHIHQMCHFLIVNTTQKSVDKAVEQRIYQRLTNAIDVKDMPSLPQWIKRTIHKGDDDKALKYIDYIVTEVDSPWYGKVNMANVADKKGSLNQQSFVQAIKKYILVNSNQVSAVFGDKELPIFKNYWIALKNVIEPEEDSVFYKYNGAHLFSMFAVPFLNLLLREKDFKVQKMEKLLRKTFSLVEGDYAGVGYADFWEKGNTASAMNVSAMTKINKALVDALYAADEQSEEDIEI